MFLAFEIATILASIICLLLAAMLMVEVIGAYLPVSRKSLDHGEPGPIAVVIPAHNEAASLGATLNSVFEQIRAIDRVIVVADNCSDNTAEIGEKAGAQCLVRDDNARRGKGYALQFALEQLKGDPTDSVVFIDADCLLGDGALLSLAATAESEDRPVQALYLMQAPQEPSARLRVSEFAWAFLNHARMSGLDRLFGVSRITGSGIALPWHIASTLNIGSGEIVEDLAMTLSLTEQKKAPRLLLDAIVTSEFPISEDALTNQRARWEHGSQRLAIRRSIPCFVKGVVSGNIRLVAIALDLMIPPLINFIGLIFAVFLLSMAALFVGAPVAFGLTMAAMFCFAFSIIAGWFKVGKDSLPLSSIVGLLPFVLAKTRIYGGRGRSSSKQWTATRSGETIDNSNK